jgi:putative NIF3 family GTP cyclohydrolase 1 type 2
MKAREIREYFMKHAGWVDGSKTVDTFKCGDPEVEVKSAAVMWMLTVEAIREVKRVGANFVITHEPTFYTHVDDVSKVEKDAVYRAKRKLLDEAGLTVLRIHDSWDTWPEIGIGASLARLLDLEEVEARGRVHRTYRMTPRRLDEFARFVRGKLGMDAVGVMGEGDALVERVGLSFGAMGSIENMRTFLSMKPDVIVAGELCNWADVRYLQDSGVALVLTDHAASENPGMRELAKFVTKQFGVPATYVEVGPALRTE